MSTVMSTAKPGFRKKQIQIEIELLNEIEQVAREKFGEKVHPGNTSPPITKALNEIIRIGLKHLSKEPIQNLSLQNDDVSTQYDSKIKELKDQIQNQDLNLLSINSKIEDIERRFKYFEKHLNDEIHTRLSYLKNVLEYLYKEELTESTVWSTDESTAKDSSTESTAWSTDKSTTRKILDHNQLANIVNREKSTIIRWHKSKKFPKNLKHLTKKYRPVKDGWELLN